MGFGKEITAQAAAELERRRLRAEEEAAARREAFYARCPEARETREAITQNAAGIAKAVVRGGDVRKALEELRARAGELNARYDRLLADAGMTRRDLEPRYSCPVCKDTGVADGRLCACLKQLQRALAYRKLCSSVPLDQCTFETFSLDYYRDDPRAAAQMENILRVCRQYAEHFKPGAASWLFRGGTGLGKTHLSLAIAGKVVEKGYGVIYGSAQSFAAALERERFLRREDGGGETSQEQLAGCDLLILDDLGTEASSEYVTACLYDVINTRMLARRPTVISTNLTMQELENRYSQRFASRITGSYNKLEFLGCDIRVAKRRQQQKKG